MKPEPLRIALFLYITTTACGPTSNTDTGQASSSTSVSGGSLSFAGDVTATTGLSVTGNSTLNINSGFSGSAGVLSLTVDAGSTLGLAADGLGTPLSGLTSLSLAAAGVDQLEPDETGGLGADWLVLLLGGLLLLAATLTVRSRTRIRIDDASPVPTSESTRGATHD